MSFNHWLLFTSVVFAIIVTPGPAAALCLSHGVSHGRVKALITVLGLVLSSLTLIALSLLGLGAVIATSATLFMIIKYVGAVYLIYVGISIWRATPASGKTATHASATEGSSGLVVLLRTGYLVGISNPKDLLFFGALFPQFIDTSAPMPGQVAVLSATWCVVAFMVMSVYAAIGAKVSSKLENLSAQGIFNRITGGAFITAGGALAWVKPSDTAP